MGDFEQLSAEAIPQFQQGISLTLSNWDALDAGLANGFGNRDQVQSFASRIFNFFHQPNRKEEIFIDDLEDLLWDGLVSLGIVAEDNSVEEVAYDLMSMHQECLEGHYQLIQKLREKRPSSVVRQIVNASDEDEDEDEDDDASDMMVDSQGFVPHANPTPVQKSESSHTRQVVDEDGWATVSSRKNRSRNH